MPVELEVTDKDTVRRALQDPLDPAVEGVELLSGRMLDGVVKVVQVDPEVPVELGGPRDPQEPQVELDTLDREETTPEDTRELEVKLVEPAGPLDLRFSTRDLLQ